MNTPEYDEMANRGQNTFATPAEPGGIWGRIQVVNETTQELYDQVTRLEKTLDSFLKPRYDGGEKDPGEAVARIETRSDIQIKLDDMIDNNRRLADRISELNSRVDI